MQVRALWVEQLGIFIIHKPLNSKKSALHFVQTWPDTSKQLGIENRHWLFEREYPSIHFWQVSSIWFKQLGILGIKEHLPKLFTT